LRGVDVTVRVCVTVAGVLAASLLAAPAWDSAASEELRLPVPYVRQTKALCGGAAAAMVFRYWGDEDAGVRQFAPLLSRKAAGLATDVLEEAIEDRGWRVVRFTGSIESVADLVRNRRPVIVLLQERAGRYHYVVVVGFSGTRIVIHDPARGPWRAVPFGTFMKAWEPAGFWALLVLPSASR
jgi:ABC-type bacteriocin/lantibiotic exporter with double-glycine peptidase domain